MIKTSVPYLVFNDDCAEALTYYADVFGAEIVEKMTYEDMEGMGYAGDINRKSCIGHSSFKLGEGLLYAGDAVDKEYLQNKVNNTQTSIWLEIDSVEDISELEKKMLATGSTSIEALHETFFGSKYAKIKDKFGIVWELNAQL